MIYAVIGKGGTVENRIELDPKSVIDFAARIERTLIPDDQGTAVNGCVWDGKRFVPPAPPPPPEPKPFALALLLPDEMERFKKLLVSSSVITQERADAIFAPPK